MIGLLFIAAAAGAPTVEESSYMNEVWTREQEEAAGITRSSGDEELVDAPAAKDLPKGFTWCNKGELDLCSV